MKKIVLFTMFSLCINSAQAVESTVMKLQGKLTNSSCLPELSNGGVADYGIVHLGALSHTAVNQLGQKDFTLTINCVTPTKIAFSTYDDRTGTSPNILVENGTNDARNVSDPDKLFGVNLTTDGVKIGNYSMFIKASSLTIDGAAGKIIYSTNNGLNWTNINVGGVMYNRKPRIVSVSAPDKDALTPLAFSTAILPMTTALAIQPTDTLAITDDTNIDGQATFTLIYL